LPPRRRDANPIRMPEPRAALPQLPGGPDPAEPVPRTPVQGFDLAAFAALAAKLARRAEPRAVVLGAAGLDERSWLEVEKTWLLRIAAALLLGDTSLGREYDEAFAAARDGRPALTSPA
jgi:hypothetical protein